MNTQLCLEMEHMKTSKKAMLLFPATKDTWKIFIYIIVSDMIIPLLRGSFIFVLSNEMIPLP